MGALENLACKGSCIESVVEPPELFEVCGPTLEASEAEVCVKAPPAGETDTGD